MGSFKVVLTDFERTLVRLFEKRDVEKEFFDEVWTLCITRGVPRRVLKAGGQSPYSLWTKAYRWATGRRRDRLCADRMYHALSRIALTYEMNVADSVRLLDGVQPVLEQLKVAGIPVVVVSNNATRAVEEILRNNKVLKEGKEEGLIDLVVGRDYEHKLLGNLKPRPLLLTRALRLSGCTADTAVLVGDSVDDMKAGRKARIRFRVGLLEHSTATKWQLRRAGADLVLSRFEDLRQVFPAGDVFRVG